MRLINLYALSMKGSRNRSLWLLVVFTLGTVIALSGCLEQKEDIQIPNIIIGVDSFNPPAYRGNTALVNLAISGINIAKGTEISLNYKTRIWNTDGIWEADPASVQLIPERKSLVFQRSVRAGETPEKLYSNLTISVDEKADEGEYYITVSGKEKDLVFGNAVLSFKIGKGGKLPLPEENIWNIGLTRDQHPPLTEIEKAEAVTIAVNDTNFRDKGHNIVWVGSDFYDSGDFSGFFPVVAINHGEEERSGSIVTVDLEEKKVLGISFFHGTPAPGGFDERFFIKEWFAGNFVGFWRDPETGNSTETLVIDQKILNNSYRVIDKHNLIYTTKPITLNYEVYANANRTPAGTNGYYSALGWQGEKYVLLPEKKIARIILEQNEFDESLMRPGETWNLGEGYSILVNSVEIKAGVPQTWFILIRDGKKISDVILGPYIEKLYTYQIEQNSSPILIVYFSGFKLDGAAFKYGWLRSQNTTEIRAGGIFGIMEVTSDNNGIIELRNRVPIELAPDSTVNLMGNLNIKVGSSNTNLSFYPYRVKESNDI